MFPSLVKAIGWSRFWPQHRTRRQEGEYSAPLYVQGSGCRRGCVAGIGTIVAAVPTQAAAAGHPLPQIVLADHADLPAAAALQVEDPLRLNHAHSSARSGFWGTAAAASKSTREAKLVNIGTPLPGSARRADLTSSLRDLPGVVSD